MEVIGFGLTDGFLTGDEVDMILADSLAKLPLDGQRVLVLIPDATRTMPLHLFFSLLTVRLLGRVRALDFMVALGTHPPLDEEALLRLVGLTPEQKAASYPNVNLFNHAWKDPQALVTLGTIPADEIARLIPAEIAGVGAQRLVMDVPVRLNRRILDYDHLLICGPVFPHEVVGFSGGNKYFFPGIAGSDIIDFTHWLGALITSRRTIGVKDTPMRRVIDRAAAMIPRPRHALCSVVTTEGIAGLFCGVPEAAWSAAADLSAQRHIHWCDRPYRRALAVLPRMYDELWVGAKGMYKLEPVIADGGELIIYAPHLKRVSAVHG
ncbi:MAG: DUF2088 domain-containing protein, partial [Chloroflexi bacterium]|nr:DUF2088 domain-containing protein [Chloroflexota bacterium]